MLQTSARPTSGAGVNIMAGVREDKIEGSKQIFDLCSVPFFLCLAQSLSSGESRVYVMGTEWTQNFSRFGTLHVLHKRSAHILEIHQVHNFYWPAIYSGAHLSPSTDWPEVQFWKNYNNMLLKLDLKGYKSNFKRQISESLLIKDEILNLNIQKHAYRLNLYNWHHNQTIWLTSIQCLLIFIYSYPDDVLWM